MRSYIIAAVVTVFVVACVAAGYFYWSHQNHRKTGKTTAKDIALQDADLPLLRGYELHGIDVSHHQYDIDWQQVVRKSVNGKPISFVFIKATQASWHVDTRFHYNWQQAKKQGLIRGAYHFFKPGVDGKAQALHFIRNVRLEEGDFVPVLDVEVADGMSKKALQREVKEWLHTVERHYGKRPMIYSGKRFMKLPCKGLLTIIRFG